MIKVRKYLMTFGLVIGLLLSSTLGVFAQGNAATTAGTSKTSIVELINLNNPNAFSSASKVANLLYDAITPSNLDFDIDKAIENVSSEYIIEDMLNQNIISPKRPSQVINNVLMLLDSIGVTMSSETKAEIIKDYTPEKNEAYTTFYRCMFGIQNNKLVVVPIHLTTTTKSNYYRVTVKVLKIIAPL